MAQSPIRQRDREVGTESLSGRTEGHYSCADVIVLCVILFVPLPEISVITAMYVQDEKWERVSGNPALVRKP